MGLFCLLVNWYGGFCLCGDLCKTFMLCLSGLVLLYGLEIVFTPGGLSCSPPGFELLSSELIPRPLPVALNLLAGLDWSSLSESIRIFLVVSFFFLFLKLCTLELATSK